MVVERGGARGDRAGCRRRRLDAFRGQAGGFGERLRDVRVHRTARRSARSTSLQRVRDVGDVLVQPFADEVPRDGEYSFTFIDGAFSHATIKRATAGEFRVQTEHGGRVDRVEASESLVAQAARVLGVLPEMPLYARVDGIARGDAFLLMELELIEPNLFLEYEDGAAAPHGASDRRAPRVDSSGQSARIAITGSTRAARRAGR